MNKLREIRQEMGITLRELAVRAGCSSATVGDIENFGYTPRPDTQEKIALALGLSPDEIWGVDTGPSREVQIPNHMNRTVPADSQVTGTVLGERNNG